jgi:hypothetical protein
MKLIEVLQDFQMKRHKIQMWLGNSGNVEGYITEVNDDCIKIVRDPGMDNHTLLVAIAHISGIIDLDQETIDQ